MNKVKTTDATTSKSSTNVQKSENVVKQESTVSSSSTVKQKTVSDASTTINVQNTNTVNEVSTTDIQNQNSVQNTSNVNDVKVNADNTSAISETTNNTTQTSSQPSTTDSKTVDTSNQTTTVTNPVTNDNTETSKTVRLESSVPTSTNQTTVNSTNTSLPVINQPTTNGIEQYAAGGETTAPTFTVDQVKDAASRVRAYIENNHKLPAYVQISTYQVNMNQFLEMLASALLQINNGTNNPLSLSSFPAPTSPQDTIAAGNLVKSEYLKIASDIKNYMDSSGKTPDYAYQTSLGTKLGYQNLVYMYSMILDYYNTSGKMADYAIMKPWSAVTTTASGTVGDPSVAPSTLTAAPNGTTFTVAQIKDAASRVRAYIETTKKLPNYVQISTYQVNMNQFLQMLASALLQINNGTNNPITVKSFSAPANPKDNIAAGNLVKSEYLKIANDIKNYMDSTGKTPDYAYQTSLGTYLGYQNLVYMYSMILDYYNTSGKMADYAIMKPWSVVSGTATPVPAELQPYIIPTANAQSDNAQIKALAASITSGKTSTYDKAVAIFNWVRDNLSYSFYYNTQYGAVGALNAGTGNCVDTSHLLIALERAAGIPARYAHGDVRFPSGNTYGHVWAEIWVDGKWYTADAISNYNTFGYMSGTVVSFKGYHISLPF